MRLTLTRLESEANMAKQNCTYCGKGAGKVGNVLGTNNCPICGTGKEKVRGKVDKSVNDAIKAAPNDKLSRIRAGRAAQKKKR